MSGERPNPAPAPTIEPRGVVDKLILRGENAQLTADEVSAASINTALQTVRTRSAEDRLHLRDAIDAWKIRNAAQVDIHRELDRLKAGTQVETGSAAFVRVQDAVSNQFDAIRDSRASSGDKLRAWAGIVGPLAAIGGFLMRKSERQVQETVQDPAFPNDPTKKITRAKTQPDPENPNGPPIPVMESSGMGKFFKFIGIAGVAATLASWGSAVAVSREQRNANVAQGPIPGTRPRTGTGSVFRPRGGNPPTRPAGSQPIPPASV